MNVRCDEETFFCGVHLLSLGFFSSLPPSLLFNFYCILKRYKRTWGLHASTGAWQLEKLYLFRNKQKRVINLVFYAQSSSTVVSGQETKDNPNKRNLNASKEVKQLIVQHTDLLTTTHWKWHTLTKLTSLTTFGKRFRMALEQRWPWSNQAKQQKASVYVSRTTEMTQQYLKVTLNSHKPYICTTNPKQPQTLHMRNQP